MKITEKRAGENARTYANRMILENIVNLELPPGVGLSENELSIQLKLSRTPVREALIELDKVQIIKIVPQKRTMVAPINYDLVDEACFMRNTLERELVRLVCRYTNETGLFRLEENVRLQQFYLKQSDFRKLMQLDDNFHAILFEVAQKPQVYRLLQDITIHFDRVRWMALESVKELKIVQDHEQILEALRTRDAGQAEALVLFIITACVSGLQVYLTKKKEVEA